MAKQGPRPKKLPQNIGVPVEHLETPAPRVETPVSQNISATAYPSFGAIERKHSYGTWLRVVAIFLMGAGIVYFAIAGEGAIDSISQNRSTYQNALATLDAIGTAAKQKELAATDIAALEALLPAEGDILDSVFPEISALAKANQVRSDIQLDPAGSKGAPSAAYRSIGAVLRADGKASDLLAFFAATSESSHFFLRTDSWSITPQDKGYQLEIRGALLLR